MVSGTDRKASKQDYALAGLETGTLATLGMIGWLGLCSMWYRRSFWNAANLLASTFYGERALHDRFTNHTFAGLALLLVIYGLVGVLFGLAMQERRGGLLALVGVLEGIVFYYLIFGWVLKHWNPLIPLYLQERPMQTGHMIYGALLGYYGRNLRRVVE